MHVRYLEQKNHSGTHHNKRWWRNHNVASGTRDIHHCAKVLQELFASRIVTAVSRRELLEDEGHQESLQKLHEHK